MKKYFSIGLLALGLVAATAQPHSRARINKQDTDGDGQISLEEFLVGAEARFHKMDADGDGVLTQADASARRSERAIKMIGSRLMLKADADASGTVTVEEWQGFIAGLEAGEDGGLDLSQLVGERRGRRGPSGPEGEKSEGSPLDLNENGILDADDLNGVFAKLDENQNAVIDQDELALRRAREGRARGPRSGSRRGGFFQRADSDGNGEVSAEEWQAFLSAIPASESGAIDVAAWLGERGEWFARALDLNENGVLEISDLNAAFGRLDANEDGTLQREELRKRRGPKRSRGPRGG